MDVFGCVMDGRIGECIDYAHYENRNYFLVYNVKGKTYNWVRSLDFGVNRICLNRICIKF